MAEDAGSIYSEVRILLDKLKGDISKVEAEFNKYGKKNDEQAQKVEKKWTDSFQKISLAGVAAFIALGAAVKKAVSTFAGFEQSMANVQSVAGGTAEEFAILEAAAKEAGETTRFTASEAADALYALASAGLSATEATDALNGVLQLAGATGSDLASTSAAVTATLSQYSLEAADATRVSNVFAAAIGNSQANMEKLTNAFRQVGPVAGALGISLEETTGALQALLDAGYQGEQAGTALRNILASLANETDPTVVKLKNLGLAFEDLNPETNSLAEIIGTLAEKGLSAGEAMDAFGTRAGGQIITLLNAGQAGIEEYTNAVTNTTAAADMYATQNDTLAGSTDALKSAIEGATITFVKDWTPALRGAVDVIKNVVLFMGKIPQPLRLFLSILTIGIPVVLAAAAGIAKLTTAVTALWATSSAVLGPIGLAVAGIAALVAGIVAIRNQQLKNIEKEFGDLAEEIEVSTKRMEQLVKTAKALGATDENIDDVIKKVKELSDELGITEKQMRLVSDALEQGSLSTTYKDAATQVRLLAESQGLTMEQVADIGLLNENITEEYRQQLERIQRIERAERERKAVGDEIANQAEMHRGRLQRQQEIREKEVDAAVQLADLDREQQLAEKGYSEEQIKNILAREQAERDYDAALRVTQRRMAAGVETEAEGLERNLKAAETYRLALADLGYTAETGGTLGQEAFIAMEKAIADAKARLAELNTETKTSAEVNQEVLSIMEEYDQKMIDLNASEEDLLTADINRALASLNASNASAEEIERVIQKIEEYHAALADNTSAKKFKENLETALTQTLDGFTDIINALQNLFDATTEKRLEQIDAELQAQLEAEGLAEEAKVERLRRELEEARGTTTTRLEQIDAELQAALEAEGLAEETKIGRLERQLEEAKAEGDAENILYYQNALRKAEIEEEYAEKKAEAEKEALILEKENALRRAEIEAEYEKRKAQAEYEGKLQSWKLTKLAAIASIADAILKAMDSAPWPWNLIPMGFAAAAGVVQMAAINKSKPTPPRLETGGIVLPQSGGVPTVQAENGYPELSLNGGPEGAALMGQFADAIAARMGGSKQTKINLYMDAKLVAESSAEFYNENQVELKLK